MENSNNIEKLQKSELDTEARKFVLLVQCGNVRAEARLLDLYKGYTASMIRQYKGKGLTDEEIKYACESALLRAARKFDLDMDFAFISYAIWWIKEGVLQAQKVKRMEKINQILPNNNMTKTELGNYDALKAIKEQLENNQDKTITVTASVGKLDFIEEITIQKEAWDKIVEFATLEVKCSIEDEESMESTTTNDVVYHLQCRGISMTSILDQCDKLQDLRNIMMAELLASEDSDREEYSMLEGIKDVKVAMCGCNDDDDNMSDEQIVFIHDEYPQILIDEIETKL